MNENKILPSDNNEAPQKPKKIVQRLKNLKNKEIIFTLVIALIAIIIYFSVNSITDSQTKQTSYTKNNGEQSQIEKVLSQIDGVGYCNVVITFINEGKLQQSNNCDKSENIIGIVVVAEGGDNVYSKIKITEALYTLLNIEEKQIKIYKSK